MNLDINYPKLFDLEEFTAKIKLSDNVKYHLQDTNEELRKYFNFLATTNDGFAYFVFKDEFMREVIYSSEMEGKKFDVDSLKEKDIFFDRLSISKRRIQNIHKFVMEHSEKKGNKFEYKYRSRDVEISGLNNGKKVICYLPPHAEDVEQFMKSFMKVYKNNNLGDLNNPILKAALIHLLFIESAVSCHDS